MRLKVQAFRAMSILSMRKSVALTTAKSANSRFFLCGVDRITNLNEK